MPLLQYPLNLRFKLIALAPRIHVTDAAGTERMFIHQRTWKLKEDVLVYNNSDKERVIFRIRADRIIDFSAKYNFVQIVEGDQEKPLGSVKRKGMRSLWRATYYSDNPAGVTTHHTKEDNPWSKVGNAVMESIPIVNFFSGYFFHPAFTIYRGENRQNESQPVMRLEKQPAFWESSYEIQLMDQNVSSDEELQTLLSLIMIVQLERRRG
jgi:hypothetical protein